MAQVDKVKVLVVGDSGVGKSSAVHLLCYNRPLGNALWTVGCSVEVKLHEYREGTASQKSYFVELWDIGGSSSHRSARAVFYHSFHGLILVHDLTNRKSHENLRKWLAEVFCRDWQAKKSNGLLEFDQEMFADNQVPILVVATKTDLVPSTAGRQAATVADECGTDQDNHNPKSLAPGSSNALKLTRFLDKVVERRFHGLAGQPTNSIPVVDRRRAKLSHLD